MKAHLVEVFIWLLIWSFPSIAFSQGKQAYNWFFGDHAGLNFASVPPAPLTGAFNTREGCTSISTAQGDLLFYTDGIEVFNRNHVRMPNGFNLKGDPSSTQSAIIVPRPGSETEYYVFTVGASETTHLIYGVCYSKVDMSLDNGMGDIVTSEKNIQLVPYTCEKVTAVGHSDGESFWVVTHKFGNSDFYAYRVTVDGVDKDNPVITTAGPEISGFENNARGYMKISPDGEWLVLANEVDATVGFYQFDNTTGSVAHVVTDGDLLEYAYGVEFSPNSSLVYISNRYSSPDIVQYNLSSGDPAGIVNSRILMTLGSPSLSTGALQLGPDNMIYIARYQSQYLSRINQPNMPGTACGLEDNAVYLGGTNTSEEGLPPFIQSFFQPLITSHSPGCSGQPTSFSIADPSGIDSVKWEFNDPPNAPYDVSTELSPAYQFSHADTFYVKLTAWSELGVREVIDTVIVWQGPEPDLGPDVSICDNAAINITLDAGEGDMYNWNNNLNPGGQTYTVTAPGTYTVRVVGNGCIGRDTINVTRYYAPTVDTTQAVTVTANCGAPDGSITGIVISGEPWSGIEWRNGAGEIVGHDITLTGIGAGIYTFHVFYGGICEVEPYVFEIGNTTAPEIAGVVPVADHCNMGIGSLTVSVTPGPSEPYIYSINGVNFFSSGVFTGLTEGDYQVTVRDINNCESFQMVHVPEIPGPQVTDSLTTPETNYFADGTITVEATGDSVYYSINGVDYQGTGIFTGLTAGPYTVGVYDKWGCVRWVNLMVDRINGNMLTATAGNDYKCSGTAAYSTLTASGFTDIKEYKAILTYNNTYLRCISYHPDPEFEDIKVTDYNGSVEVLWQDTSGKTLPGSIPLVELIFETKDWGAADIKWDTVYSQFTDSHGNILYTSLNPGTITIYNPPLIQDDNLKTEFCEGEQAEITVSISGGTSPVDLIWTTPGNTTVAGPVFQIDSITAGQSGKYTVSARDLNNCNDMLEIPVTVYPLPSANFPTTNDTIYFDQQTTLSATPGYAAYQWNTGDTTYYTLVDEQGEYSVLMQTASGCAKTESVYMFNIYVPVQVPNAFTPNSDGLNDVFRPVADKELVRRFHMSVYNKWGQRLYETSDPSAGWDGKDALPGVYVWVISYENMLGIKYELTGRVSLVE